MSGVNKVIIVGNLGNAPECKTLPNGDCVATLSVATSESWTDQRSGEKVTRTEWHRVIYFRRLAEIARDYLKKGAKIYVEGKLRTRQWQAQDGTDRYTTEIIGDSLQMLSSKDSDTPSQAQSQSASKTNAQAKGKNQSAADQFDDDIPF